MAKTDRSQTPTFTKTKLAAAIAAASGLAAPAPVAAQESAGASPAIEEVIVTARKREANIQDTAVSIQAFTEDDLDRHGSRPLRGLRRPVAVHLLRQRRTGNPVDAHPRGLRRWDPARLPDQRGHDQLLPGRAAGQRSRRRRPGPAPLRHRTHRGAARPGGHVLRRELRLRHRAHHHQQTRSRGPQLRHGPERRLDFPRRHRLHGRGTREPAAVGALCGPGRVLARQVERLRRQPAHRLHLHQRRHGQQPPLGRRGLQRGGDHRCARLVCSST